MENITPQGISESMDSTTATAEPVIDNVAPAVEDTTTPEVEEQDTPATNEKADANSDAPVEEDPEEIMEFCGLKFKRRHFTTVFRAMDDLAECTVNQAEEISEMEGDHQGTAAHVFLAVITRMASKSLHHASLEAVQAMVFENGKPQTFDGFLKALVCAPIAVGVVEKVTSRMQETFPSEFEKIGGQDNPSDSDSGAPKVPDIPFTVFGDNPFA